MSKPFVVATLSIPLIASTAMSLHCGGSAPGAATPGGSGRSADACITIASAKRMPSPSEPAKITARHVLVQYQGAKTAKVHIVRFRDEACLRALDARDELRAGAQFAEVAKKYTDEPGGDARGGSLGPIERKDVVPAFADAAFGLQVGEISDVVETEFGFHIIMREE